MNDFKLFGGGYDTFKKSLPENLRGTDESDYKMRYYWRKSGRPQNFEAAQSGENPMFSLEKDGTYHAPTVEPKSGKFLKSKYHPSVGEEYDWFENSQSEDAHAQREKYYINDKGKFPKYVEKKKELPEMPDTETSLDSDKPEITGSDIAGGAMKAFGFGAQMYQRGQTTVGSAKEGDMQALALTASGGKTGMEIGSMFGPKGAILGAGVGALTGMVSGIINNKRDKNRRQRLAQKQYDTGLKKTAYERDRDNMMEDATANIQMEKNAYAKQLNLIGSKYL